MNNILWSYLDKFIIVYLNNIIIYSKIKKEYLEYDEKVFKALFDYQLYAKLSKYIISIKNIEFYRHIVENSSIKLVTSRVKIIDEWFISKNVHEVQ